MIRPKPRRKDRWRGIGYHCVFCCSLRVSLGWVSLSYCILSIPSTRSGLFLIIFSLIYKMFPLVELWYSRMFLSPFCIVVLTTRNCHVWKSKASETPQLARKVGKPGLDSWHFICDLSALTRLRTKADFIRFPRRLFFDAYRVRALALCQLSRCQAQMLGVILHSMRTEWKKPA